MNCPPFSYVTNSATRSYRNDKGRSESGFGRTTRGVAVMPRSSTPPTTDRYRSPLVRVLCTKHTHAHTSTTRGKVCAFGGRVSHARALIYRVPRRAGEETLERGRCGTRRRWERAWGTRPGAGNKSAGSDRIRSPHLRPPSCRARVITFIQTIGTRNFNPSPARHGGNRGRSPDENSRAINDPRARRRCRARPPTFAR